MEAVILVSNDNGTTWSLKSTDYVFEDLTYGNGKFIGVQFKQINQDMVGPMKEYIHQQMERIGL